MNLHVILEVLLGVAFVVTDRALETLHFCVIDDLVSLVFAVVGKGLSTELAINLLSAVCQVDVTPQESQ